MSIDLTSRLSAIATGPNRQTYVVWVEANRIWCAIYDNNSATWKDAQAIADIGTQSVTGLNLIFDESLIQESGSVSTNSPGLAVVYQQGTDNDSNFFYTAAQYDVNGNLQWLDSPQALTADQVGDLEPQAIAYEQNGLTDVLVIGQKVNIDNTNNLGIREDTDLYYQTFSIDSNQFASSSIATSSTDASYTPQTSKDGVVQGNLYLYPGQTVTAPAASYSVLSASEATSVLNTTTSNSSYNGLGFNWNASQSFDTNLLAFNILNKSPDQPNSILSNIFKTINISGTLQGSSGNNPEFTLFGGGVDTTGALLNAIASIGIQNNKNGTNGGSGQDFQGTINNKFSVSLFLSTLYSYGTTPDSSGRYPLNNETGSLGLSLGINIPIVDEPPFFINFLGSVGVTLQWQLSPVDPDTFVSPLAAALSPTGGGSEGLLMGVITIPPVGAVSAIALALSSDVSEIIEVADGSVTDSQLQLESLLLGIPVSVGAELGVKIPFLFQLSGSGKVFVDGTFGQTLGTKEETFTLGFPLSLTLKLLGFLGGTIEIFPSWTWPTTTSSTSSLNSSAIATSLSSSPEIFASNSPTASVNGSLLTLDFPTTLNTLLNPDPTEFTVTVTDVSGNPVNIPVFDAIVQENSVILRLEQTIPYSTLNDQPFSNIQVSYIPGNTPLEDTQGESIPDFTIAVTNNTSQNFVYFYNPTSGTDNTYVNTQQQIAVNFNTPLDTNSDAIPSTTQFIVMSSSGPIITVSTVAVNQNSVTLTLAQNIPSENSYIVEYIPNLSGVNNLQDASNNSIPTFTINSITSPTEAGIVNSTFASNAHTNQLIANLSEDFAQDSPPTLAPTANGNVLIAWSSDTPPLTPVSVVTDGSKIYLTFADNLNNAINQMPTNSQFTITVNGNQDNVTVSNIDLDENTITLNLSDTLQASDTVEVVYSLNTNSSNYNNNLNLTDATNTVLWVPIFNSNVTLTGNSTVAPQPLQARGLSNLLTLTFDQVLNTNNIPNGCQFKVFINNNTVTVGDVNVNTTSVVLTLAQAIAQGDVISISYNTTCSPSDNLGDNLTSNSGILVNDFTTHNVITTSSSPGTVIKVGTNNNTSNLSSIPGTSGLNFDAALVFDNDTQLNVIAWVHTDEVDLPPLSIPGQVYTSEQTTLINNSLSASDIYYSVLGANNQWSIAAPLVSQQPGQDTNVTLGEGPNGELMAAWLNTQQDSNGDTTTIINWSSWNGKAWTTPQIVLSEITPDPATNLSISSINDQPAIFWTETQAASYSTKVFDQNPLIYLRLADLNGTTAKNSGQLLGSANGTYNGDFTLRQVGALEDKDTNTQSGDRNPAVLFNGGGVTLNTAIPVTNRGFTVEFWFKLPSLLSAGQTLNLVSMGGVFAIALEGLTGGTALSFSLANADSSQIQTTVDSPEQTIQTEDWYYVAGTYSGPNQTLSLYLNGSPVGSLSNISFSDLPDSGTLSLAGSSGSIYLDEVAFYPSVLTYADVSPADITAANFQNITGSQLVDLLSGANQIGSHYDAQYVQPLPPGPQTHYSIWDSSSNSWETPSQIDPVLKPVATSLSDANNPIWDIVSDSASLASGNISPNGRADYVFQISLTGQQTKTIVGIVVSVSDTDIVWAVGTDENGASLSSSQNNAWQLGVVLGDTLLNSLNPNAPSFNYRVMGNAETFTLFGDTSELIPTNPTINATVYFEGNDTQLPVAATQQPNNGGSVSANSTDILGTTVLGIATVTEANDSSLSLIDSGFVIDTNNSAIGSVLASAFNSDGSLAYVAVGNRGYTDTQGNPNQDGGTVQVLFNGGDVLTDSESNPLTATDLSGNPDGVLITGLTDTGTANKNVAIALATGDIDGDGIDDLVIGNANANEGNGAIYVFYGSYLNSLKNQNQTIDISQLSAMPSSQGFLINGADNSQEFAGFSVAVGNFDGDNYEDIAFGAPLASKDDTTGAGNVYVVNGFAQSPSSDLTANLIYTGKTFEIPNPSPTVTANTSPNVTVGEGVGFSLGVSHYTVDGAKTFSGSTTTDDLFIGAPGYQIEVTNQWNGKSGLPSDSQSLYPDTTWIAAGAVYVFSGSQGFQNGSLSPLHTYTGPGVPGANGVAANYFAGTAIASSDFMDQNMDIDGDGQQDLAISAIGANSNTGVVYVVNGSTASTSASPQDLSQVSNLIINGGLTGSQTGTVITSPGDLNNDTYQDFLITSPQAANGTAQNYLLFGPLNLDQVGTMFDLNVTANDNKKTFLLNGSEPLQLTGTAAIGIGDINGDSVDDLMLTAPNAQQAYAVFGHPWLADDGSIKLADISADNGFVIDGEMLGLSVNGTIVEMLGDINNDGFADVFSGGADGGVIIFGGSTKDLLDGSLGTRDLLIDIDSNNFSIQQVLSLGDTNGDGLPDLGIVGSNNLLYLILGSENLGSVGTITLADTLAESSPSVKTTVSVSNVGGAIANFSGNGYSDFVYSIPAPYQAVLEPNGQLIVQNSQGETTYSSNYSAGGSFLALAGNDIMDAFGVLGVTAGLNPNSNTNNLVGYTLVMQPDQNLVLYEVYSNGSQNEIWASNTNPSSSAPSESIFLTMQSDGNLVLSAGGTALWATNTNGDASDGGPNGQNKTPALPGAELALFNDGTLGLIQYQQTKDESGYALVFVINNGTAYNDYYSGTEITIPSGASGQPVPSKDQFIMGLEGSTKPVYTFLPADSSLTANASNSLLYTPTAINDVPITDYLGISPNTKGSLNLTIQGSLVLIVNDFSGNPSLTSLTSATDYPYSSSDPQSSLSENQILVPVLGLNTLAAAPNGSQIQLLLGGENPLSQSAGNATVANANHLGALTGVGDLNGDGYGDAALGYGQAELVTTGAFTYTSTVDLMAGNGAAQLAVTTSDTGSGFRGSNGFISSPGGDVNGDGLADLVVFSPILQVGMIAQVFAGNTDLNGVFSNQPLLTINYNLFSVNIPALTSPVNITAIGDVNADGYDDLLLSLPNTVNPNDSNGDLSGVAYVIFGSSTPRTIELNPDTNNPNQSLATNPQLGFAITGLPASNAGYAISGGEDINGDGFDDFIIGAPGNNDNLSYVIFGSDFNNTVNQTGTIGNDVMIGTATGESFVAGQGDDQIYSNGGVDVVYGGPGNDFITVSDTYFRRIDGGTGNDRLKFTGYNGQDWDLTVLSPGQRLSNLESLDLRDYGTNTLTLNALTVTALASNNQLTIFLDAQDNLNLSADFNYTGTIYQSNQRFYQYQSNNSAATLFVNQPLGQTTYQLVLNAQGSLVLLSPTGETVWTATDSTGNTITGGQQALMQTDGNFVLYDSVQAVNQPGPPSAALWATGTSGEDGAYLRLESNGSLVVVSANSSDTILDTLYAGTAETSTAESNFHSTQQLLVNQTLTVFENNFNLTASVTNHPNPIWPTEDSSSSVSANSLSTEAIAPSLASTGDFTSSPPITNTINEPTKLFVTNPFVPEDSGQAIFTIQRTGNLTKSALISYQTKDGDGKAGDRYVPVAGRLLFNPGETHKTVTVNIPDNGRFVGDRQFGLAVTLDGESTDAAVVPDAWEVAIATPNEQIRRWNRLSGEDGNSVLFNITSTHSPDRIVTFDMDLDGLVLPFIWNPATTSYENIPFNSVNGITQLQDIDGNNLSDLYRMKFQDGGPFDGDGIVNGLVALDFRLAELKPVEVPLTGGRISGTEDNDYFNTQGQSGTYRFEGLGGVDVLNGSNQRDVLTGDGDNDRLFGNGGVDQLFGGEGNDYLDGGLDLDLLYGGTGADNFVLRSGDGTDRIMDFNATEGDLFLLDQISFGSLTFNNNQILLDAEILAIVIDANRQPVTNFANNPQWFASI